MTILLSLALLLGLQSDAKSDVSKKEDPWQKVIDLKSGSDVRVIKKGAAGKPVLGVFDEANAERIVVVVKNEQIAIPKEEIDRLDARPKGGSRMTRETKSTQNMPMDRPPAANPGEGIRPTPPNTTSSTSSSVTLGNKPDFETIYRRLWTSRQ